MKLFHGFYKIRVRLLMGFAVAFLATAAFAGLSYSYFARMERKLIGDYEATVQVLLDGLDDDRLALAVEIASIPEHIRGFGHVKEAHFEQAKAREAALLAQWRNPKALHIVQVA